MTTRADGVTVDRTFLLSYDGDAVGTGEGLTSGRGTLTFEGQIDGLGTGTFTAEQIDFVATTYFAVGVITGGTGDFEGAGGTIRFDPNTYVIEIEVPQVPIERPRQFDLETSWSDDGVVEQPPAADGSVSYTGRTTFAGQLAGDTPFVGVKQLGADGIWIGTDELAFTGTIDGIGTGTLRMTDVWRSDQNGHYVNALRIVGGTGDFEGADGWLLLRSTDGGTTGAGTGEIRVPATGSLRWAGTVETTFGSVDADNRTAYSSVATYFGDIEGTLSAEGVEQHDADAPANTTSSTGSATGSGTITVVGVGTGTITFDEEWWSDVDGHVIGEATITSADGDLAGMTRTIRWNTTDTAQTVAYQADFRFADG
ncbi:MAG: hypothetical protein KDB37_16345 [Ilumatobacter sp.]|nr:hypothetical protein [Ilumatobacter sp.]